MEEEKKDEILEQDLRIGECIIDGIDTVAGLRNVGGSLEVYLDVLKCFVSEVKSTVLKLPELLLENEATFYTKLHGTKSNCIIIGDNTDADKALKLEKAYLDCDDSYIANELDPFVASVKECSDRIEDYFFRASFSKREDALEEKKLCNIPGVPRGLAAMLREALFDMELSEIENRMKIIRQDRYERRVEIYLDKIENAVKELEYDEAVKLLESITEQI